MIHWAHPVVKLVVVTLFLSSHSGPKISIVKHCPVVTQAATVTNNNWHLDATMGCYANLWTLTSLPIFMRLYMTFHLPLQPPPTSTSIHHFCMEPLFPQLPATLQTISWRTHTSRKDRSPKKVRVNIILTAATTLGLHIVSKLKESLSYCHHPRV